MSFSRASVALVLVLACLAGSVSATCYFNEFAGQFGVKSGAIFPTQTFGSATNLNGSTFTEFLVDNCATTCDANVQLTIYIYFKDSFEVSINGLTLDTAGAWVSMPQNPLLIGTTTVNPLNSAYHFYVGQDPTQTFNIFTFNYTQWQCPTGTNKVTNIVAFTTTLVGTCTEYETFEIQRQCAAVKGDPVYGHRHTHAEAGSTQPSPLTPPSPVCWRCVWCGGVAGSSGSTGSSTRCTVCRVPCSTSSALSRCS